MTVPARTFFVRHGIDGRAVLAGTLASPRVWLAEVDGHLVICRGNILAVRWIADTAAIAVHRAFYSASQIPACTCWRCEGVA